MFFIWSKHCRPYQKLTWNKWKQTIPKIGGRKSYGK
uniref:Uncharacterized protein n=1 Tax=Myoviridae sp. ct96L1 TaxID=2826623 RepID=A0A8S5N2Z6_9CAUD|nr:MAG TPA: hypothetical protein [Myoviridae sp. ct96L1]